MNIMMYGIFDLSDFFSDDKSDAGLQDKVLSLYEFAMSQSNPDGWMRRAVEPYKEAQNQDLRDTLWGSAMWDEQQAENRSYCRPHRTDATFT